MPQIHVEVSRVINASPDAIYAVIRDYEVGHPAIVPPPYFTGLEVEQGGVGAGTVVLVHMNVLGTKADYRMTVTEPEPGRVLIESDPEAGVTSIFTIDPVNGKQQARVTITSDQRVKNWLEKLITPLIVRHIFNKELDRIAHYMQQAS